MDANVIAGMLRVGFTQESIDEQIERDREHEAQQAEQQGHGAFYEVHEDAWDSWLMFLKVQNQWHFVSFKNHARRTGLNYVAVESVIRLALTPRRDWPALLGDMRVIEEAVLEADAERWAE